MYYVFWLKWPILRELNAYLKGKTLANLETYNWTFFLPAHVLERVARATEKRLYGIQEKDSFTFWK